MAYYDFDIDEEKLSGNSTVDELLYVKDLQQRKLFLNADVDQLSVAEIVKHIMQFNREDIDIHDVSKRKPILLYVVSNGGEVDAGFELIDIIRCSKTPVYTINLGFQYSMGFLIGLAGHKRFATPNARFLMHDGTSFVYNSSTKVQDQIDFQRAADKRVKDYIISRSNLTEELYDNKLRVEWYLFADEAKKHGFVDYIIGVDCEIDSVI
jgi:ATP-dependent Clp protease protease subunit